jgi:hypothetical protein
MSEKAKDIGIEFESRSKSCSRLKRYIELKSNDTAAGLARFKKWLQKLAELGAEQCSLLDRKAPKIVATETDLYTWRLNKTLWVFKYLLSR